MLLMINDSEDKGSDNVETQLQVLRSSEYN